MNKLSADHYSQYSMLKASKSPQIELSANIFLVPKISQLIQLDHKGKISLFSSRHQLIIIVRMYKNCLLPEKKKIGLFINLEG